MILVVIINHKVLGGFGKKRRRVRKMWVCWHNHVCLKACDPVAQVSVQLSLHINRSFGATAAGANEVNLRRSPDLHPM